MHESYFDAPPGAVSPGAERGWPWLAALVLACAAGCGQADDSQSRLARWVLSTPGGQVEVQSGDQRSIARDTSELPDPPFQVRSIWWDLYPGDRNTHLSDDLLAQLAEAKHLVSLDLWTAPISDAGLVHLAQLSTLEQLNLNETQITDAGLSRLVGLGRLRHLHLAGTAVTPAALAQFKQQVPDCQIVLEADSPPPIR